MRYRYRAIAVIFILFAHASAAADEMADWLVQPVDPDPEKNYYFMLLGFDAPDGVPLGRYGLEKYRKIELDKEGNENPPQTENSLNGLATLSDDMRSLRAQLGFQAFPYHCIEPNLEETALVNLLVEKYGPLLDRYRELKASTHNISDPRQLGIRDRQLLVLELNFLSVVHEIFAWRENGGSARLEALKQELAFWRRMYREADEIITKLSTLLVYRQTVALLHADGLFQRSPGIELPARLDAEDFSLLPVLKNELRGYERMLETAPSASELSTTGMRIATQLLPDRRRYLEHAFEYLSCVHALRNRPPQETLQAIVGKSHRCSIESGVVDRLINPVGTRLLSIFKEGFLESIYRHPLKFNLYQLQLEASLTLDRHSLKDPVRFGEIASELDAAHPGLHFVYDSEKSQLGFGTHGNDMAAYQGLEAIPVCSRQALPAKQ